MHKGHDDDHCYSGSLYLDGKPFAKVFNDGWGGGETFEPMSKSGLSCDEVYAKIKEIDDWFKTQPSTGICPFSKEPTFDSVADILCNSVNDFLKEREYKKVISRKWVMIDGGQCYEITKKSCPDSARFMEMAENKSAKLLNGLTLEAGMKLFYDAMKKPVGG